MKKKWVPTPATWWVDWQTIGFGVRLYTLFDRSVPAPIGLVWGIPCEQRFEVFHSYTLPCARQRGVRTAINRQILKDFKVVSTGLKSEPAGIAFLKAGGYKKSKELQCFFKAGGGRG